MKRDLSQKLLIFPILKFVKPNWYFNLLPYNDNHNFYWIDYTKLTDEEKKLINYDTTYDSKASSLKDAAYQALNIGILSHSKNKSLPSDILNQESSLYDNYKFLRKNFNFIWVLYTFILKICTFNNPINEIIIFFKTKNIKRENYFSSNNNTKIFHTLNLKNTKKVSVIIPTLNRYKYLYDVMKDLENQDYSNFEVIVIDQSEPFQENFYTQFNLDLKVTYQKEKALWKARNYAIKNSLGDYILLFDDDSRVEKNWISSHLKCLDYYNVDISSGVSLSVIGDTVPNNYAYFRWSDQLDTGNAMIKKEVFKKTGLFDRQFEKQRMGDGEYGLRAYLYGFKNISNPLAQRVHLKVADGGLREVGAWDAFRTNKLLAPKPIPSTLYLTRKYFGTQLSLYYLLKSVPPSIMPYKFKKNKLLSFLGVFISIAILPLIIYQVIKSWNKSTQMLNNGDKIDYL